MIWSYKCICFCLCYALSGVSKTRTCWETTISLCFLCFSLLLLAQTFFGSFVMHNPWPIPQCRATPSNRMIHTVNTCFHLMMRNCSKRKKIKTWKTSWLCASVQKKVPDNRGNDTDSHHCCFFGNLHLVWSGIIEITTVRTLLMIFVFSWTWKLMKLI